jgi:uncharacterized protein GlcG (DUF336 family)
MRRMTAAVALLFASHLLGQTDPGTVPDPSACPLPLATADVCRDGAIGDQQPVAFGALGRDEVSAIVTAAAAAINVDTATIGVVDRTGRPLAVYRQANADPSNDDRALGVARSAALSSNSQAPLSSRTVRFLSGVHFPAGVTNAPSAALYGIEQSNRGCELNIVWNANQCVPPAKAVARLDQPCNASDPSGCGAGLVTGKVLPDDGPYPQTVSNRLVEAGGIPLYRVVPPGADRANEGIVSNGRLLGAVGVVGIAGDSQLNEFAAVTGAFGPLNAGLATIVPLPAYPLPEPGNVFIDGIRLPFLGPDQRLRFNENGLPIGLEQPGGTSPGTSAGMFIFGPTGGGCPPNGYLAGPHDGQRLTKAEIDAVVQRAVKAAKRTRAQVRLPPGSYARMIITIADLDGTILASYRMEDALFFSLDVSVAKARNAVYFNSGDPRARADLPGIPAGTWVTSRTVGYAAQPLYPPGIDSAVFKVGPGRFYPLYQLSLTSPCAQGSEAPGANQNGLVFFAGSTALMKNGTLAGGLGVSGDGIDQDDYVTFLGAGELLPPSDKWADRVKLDGARLPMFKFPRHPEGVTECRGKPCD